MDVRDCCVAIQTALPIEFAKSFEIPLDSFLMSQDSLHTRRAYQRHIREAFHALGVTSVSQLKHHHLGAWWELLMMDGRGAATHAQALYAMRSFLSWCADFDGLPISHRMMSKVLKAPRVEVFEPYAKLTRSEVRDLLGSAFESPRDYALTRILLGAGLLVSEVEHLDCTDLRDVDNAPVLWVRQGKGGKDRVVPVLDEVGRAIQAYLLETERLVTDSGPLFLREDRAVGNNDPTARLGDDGIRRILSKVGRRALITQKTSPQVLRHTFGLEFQRLSQDMNLTAKVLGHAPLRTTKTRMDSIELAELRTHIPSWES